MMTETLFAEELSGIPIPPKPSTSDGQIVVYDMSEKGPVRIMNAVNGAPEMQGKPSFTEWKALDIPYSRTHDFSLAASYGGAHTIEVASIFRNFDADENNPDNYDFSATDMILKRLRDAGTKIFYRLGAEYEGWFPRAYTIYPPKDFSKWARICEHIIMHYNEGWARGYTWNIDYWEIWNEPDLATEHGPNGLFWRGSRDDFKALWKTSLLHLKKRFPKLKFGGAAFTCPTSAWIEGMLKEFAAEHVPLDFYSWHLYETRPERYAAAIRTARTMLDKYGFKQTESILNEWNYVKGWDKWDQEYSFQVQQGAFSQKGAAFIAASMSVMQDENLTMAMFYSVRTRDLMDSVFHFPTGYPLRGYYAFYAWAKLRRLGTQVATTSSMKNVFVTAAKGPDGQIGLLVTRYDEDNNATRPVRMTLRLADGTSFQKATCHLTDDFRIFTETPLELNRDGSADIELRPCSFAFIELPR